MSITISTWDPARKGIPEFDGDSSFGFERYRVELWGTEAVRGVGAQLIPRLASQDLYVENADLDVLELEARSIGAAVEIIAAQLFDPSDPGPGVVVAQAGDVSSVHDAWGGRSPAASIDRYINNLLRAIDLARQAGCGVVIW